jgi:prepilin-type N-terminal cleavage/methylation domain-containing protein
MIHARQPKRAFTLVEILVVLAVIAVLAMLLLPVMHRAKEKANQASCAANLHQIGIAVRLYFQDEQRYPASLAFLLPSSANLYDPATKTSVPNTKGSGYWRASADSLLCPNDDTDAKYPRSSYGDISTDIAQGAPNDQGRVTWNYWGSRKDGTAYSNYTACGTGYYISTIPGTEGSAWYYVCNPPDEVVKASKLDVEHWARLRSRFPPASTIVTHCVYHRVPTSNLARPEDAFTKPADAVGAVDLVLRLDNSVKTEATTTLQYAVP